MKPKRAFCWSIYLIFQLTSILSSSVFAQASFSDDFNRPDSPTVGNGWSDATDNTPGSALSIMAGTLAGTASVPNTAIFRPFTFSGVVELAATFTDHNGYGCLRLGHGTYFSIYNDGTANGGYCVGFYRSDQDYNNSTISLTDNGVPVGSIDSTLQFGYSVTVDYLRFSPDGSIDGRISQSGESFNFTFPKRNVASKGANVSIRINGPDNRGCNSLTPGTVDNFTISLGYLSLNPVGFHQADDLSQGVPVFFGNPGAETDQACSEAHTGRGKTICYGCALCSAATMLRTVPGWESTTPITLDAALRSASINGYTEGDHIDFNALTRLPSIQIKVVDSRDDFQNDLSKLDAYLQQHFCSEGDRVILHLTMQVGGSSETSDHYLLVTGKSGNDWTVFDPGWRTADPQNNLLTLNGHTLGFTTVSVATGLSSFRTFTVNGARAFHFTTEPTVSFVGTVHSPVELLATDILGRRVGFDPSSTKDIFEIPDASYIRDFRIGNADGVQPGSGTVDGVKTFVIPQPLSATYQVQLAGTGAGPYELDLNTFTPGSGGQQPAPILGITTAGMTTNMPFLVIVPPRILTTSYASNTVSLTFQSQSEITYFLEGKQLLSDTNSWTTFKSVMGSGGVDTITQQSTNQIMFYRLKTQ